VRNCFKQLSIILARDLPTTNKSGGGGPRCSCSQYIHSSKAEEGADAGVRGLAGVPEETV